MMGNDNHAFEQEIIRKNVLVFFKNVINMIWFMNTKRHGGFFWRVEGIEPSISCTTSKRTNHYAIPAQVWSNKIRTCII